MQEWYQDNSMFFEFLRNSKTSSRKVSSIRFPAYLWKIDPNDAVEYYSMSKVFLNAIGTSFDACRFQLKENMENNRIKSLEHQLAILCNACRFFSNRKFHTFAIRR